jgi:hypothetical protein
MQTMGGDVGSVRVGGGSNYEAYCCLPDGCIHTAAAPIYGKTGCLVEPVLKRLLTRPAVV